jgi:hypothetical protein
VVPCELLSACCSGDLGAEGVLVRDVESKEEEEDGGSDAEGREDARHAVLRRERRLHDVGREGRHLEKAETAYATSCVEMRCPSTLGALG